MTCSDERMAISPMGGGHHKQDGNPVSMTSTHMIIQDNGDFASHHP